MKTAAIVLAGGRSARFGRDKLAELVGGRSMVERAIEAVRPVVDEVLVIAAPDATPRLPADTTLVHDERPFEGPLTGVAAGLAASDADIVLVVAGDMPWMVPAVLARLVRRLEETGVDAVVLESEGDPRPLPMALRRPVAASLAVALLARGERRLRTLRDGLALVTVPDAEWRTDDPDGRTLRDVDTPAELA